MIYDISHTLSRPISSSSCVSFNHKIASRIRSFVCRHTTVYLLARQPNRSTATEPIDMALLHPGQAGKQPRPLAPDTPLIPALSQTNERGSKFVKPGLSWGLTREIDRVATPHGSIVACQTDEGGHALRVDGSVSNLQFDVIDDLCCLFFHSLPPS